MATWNSYWGGGDAPEGSPPGRFGPGAHERASTSRAPVLVVEDEPSILEMVVLTLRAEDIPVIGVTSAREALEVVEREQPSLVLLDMRMPDMNGWQFAATLRGRGHQLPIVVMTAHNQAQSAAVEIGAAGYLAKPFDLHDLLEAIARHRRPAK